MVASSEASNLADIGFDKMRPDQLFSGAKSLRGELCGVYASTVWQNAEHVGKDWGESEVFWGIPERDVAGFSIDFIGYFLPEYKDL